MSLIPALVMIGVLLNQLNTTFVAPDGTDPRVVIERGDLSATLVAECRVSSDWRPGGFHELMRDRDGKVIIPGVAAYASSWTFHQRQQDTTLAVLCPAGTTQWRLRVSSYTSGAAVVRLDQ